MFPIIISSLLNPGEGKSKIVFPLKLLALLLLVIILSFFWAGGKIFKSERGNNSLDNFISLIGIPIGDVKAYNCSSELNCFGPGPGPGPGPDPSGCPPLDSCPSCEVSCGCDCDCTPPSVEIKVE